jgi:hypothetical protein
MYTMGKYRDFDNDIWEENEQSLRHFRGSADELEELMDHTRLRGKVDKKRRRLDVENTDVV